MCSTNSASFKERRWYQFSIWHLLVAMTVLAVASSILAQRLKPEPVEVRGLVMIDGKPLSTGRITFVLTDGKTKRRRSEPISNGTYAFSDVVESGVYHVEISSLQTTGGETVETIPSWYNSNTTLTMQLLPGSNTVDFALNSQ